MKSIHENIIILLILVGIFLFSYYIRVINVVPNQLLYFDPIFQYRYTWYFANWGTFPVWDELSYYTGRITEIYPFLYYATTMAYWVLQSFGLSLMTTAAYMAGVYGALIVFPAYLLGKELSNKYGGIIAAAFTGTAPQILVRTFGGSYDTDQLVLVFAVLTLYLGFYALKNRNIKSFCIALIGFSAFLIMWSQFWYTIFIIIGFIFVHFIVSTFFGKEKKIIERFMPNLKMMTKDLAIMIALIVILVAVGFLTISDPITNLSSLFSFAQNPAMWIVNISIAELQPTGSIAVPLLFLIASLVSITVLYNVFKKEIESPTLVGILVIFAFLLVFISGGFSYNTLTSDQKAATSFANYFYQYISVLSQSLGRIFVGNLIIDSLLFVSFIFFLAYGLIRSYKDNIAKTSFLLTMFLFSIYVLSRGVRFEEFTSSFLLIMVAAGFGYLVEWSKKDTVFKTLAVGLAIMFVLASFGIGYAQGLGIGAGSDSNWEAAFNFLRTQTPTLSLVGTWWDPGHMITGLGDRRVIADGAHCHDCFYNINARIQDLGRIMWTSNETESLNLIRKYQGDSPTVYWIASDDLIGKFRWVQYFGSGCDGTGELTYGGDSKCPLYGMAQMTQQSLNVNGTYVDTYSNIVVLNKEIPIPLIINNNNQGIMFKELIYYQNGVPVSVNLTQDTYSQIKPYMKSFNVTMTNQTFPYTIWIPSQRNYVVIIPESLRNSVFTKMFMLEGQGLQHYKEVFANGSVKIFQVI